MTDVGDQQGKGPLAGVRIIDLTTVLMGPYATQVLGDLGADVIKVESPAGDALRYAGPSRSSGMGPLFLHTNRNKRSVVLDLKTEEGLEALLRLCRTADVLTYNMRPEAMKALRLEYKDLAHENPRLIYVGMLGFSRRGPYAGNPAYDDLIQGLSGLPSLFASITDTEPRFVPANICDRTVALYAANMISAALYQRDRTGKGQAIDVPMFETMAQYVLGDHMYGKSFVPATGGAGYARLLSSERRPFPTSDGYLCVMPYSDKHWNAIFSLPHWPDNTTKDNPDFATMTGRTENITELNMLIATMLKENDTQYWLDCLSEIDVPVAPMHTLDSLMEDRHLEEIGFFETRSHPHEGDVRTMRMPSEWSDTQFPDFRHAPRLGEHTREVFEEIGFSEGEILNLFSVFAQKT